MVIFMRQNRQQPKIRGLTGRSIAIAAVSVGVMAIGGSVSAAPTARPAERGDAGAAVAHTHKPGFFETYRGHHIMGWGHDDSACAYIDGRQLVLYPAGGGSYTSALQGYQAERGLRAITKASVRVLGDLDMVAPTEPVAHCPQFGHTTSATRGTTTPR
ncbi:tyrosinase family oxidase copper chaperone [Actinoplanes sp. NPDC024001]|uniref:tyrosinase family oxidase copper chaperone n=1 Tax=Actinoplanes sp. NPDC024001 TaxID=3154598 RepID=UPI0033CA68F5